jgi:hypothetical protein
MIATVANSAWLAGCLPEYWRFRRSLHNVANEQALTLLAIVRRNRETEFGRRYGFASIGSVADFQHAVPLGDYESHRTFIERVASGIPNVLTADSIELFEPTGGSSGGTKLIPYPRTLQREFRRGIDAWIADLFLHNPYLMAGTAFWSISPDSSPRGPTQRTEGGIPIGFNDDSAYAGDWQQWQVRQVMAIPSDRIQVSDFQQARLLLALNLAAARDLRLISVWHPSYLTLLLDGMESSAEEICRGLRDGMGIRADRRRAAEVECAFVSATPQDRYRRLWPRLGLISCWSDANAAGPAARLHALFPDVCLQGKGLIATEAFVTLPLTGHDGAALAFRSHFFEFTSEDGSVLLAHQLRSGACYGVVVTTGGGLYRYNLGDRVEVIDYLGACPLFRFVGRESVFSDWVGEKLLDAHVAAVFQKVFREFGVDPAFAMLAFDTEPSSAYTLFLESDACTRIGAQIALSIDLELQSNFHYGYARRLGQIGPVRITPVSNGFESYADHAMRSGQRLGSIKVPALDPRNIWRPILTANHPQQETLSESNSYQFGEETNDSMRHPSTALNGTEYLL